MIAELRTDTELERLVACDWLSEFGTEEDWNRLLDQHHSDQQVRRRFGLWLLEQGEAKGEGYLALAACKTDCADTEEWDGPDYTLKCPYWCHESFRNQQWQKNRLLSADWFALLQVEGKQDDVAPLWALRSDASRQELEEAAATAFLLLPAERREQLLRGDL